MNQVAVSPVPAMARPPETTRTFLPYLEGIRGFFGLYIALVHAWLRASQMRPSFFPMTPFTAHFIAFSHSAVGMFIVISGYVLGLPVARRGQTFKGGYGLFAKRRALRLLPAYYAALLIAIPISLWVSPVYGEELSRHTFIESVLLHVALLHNFSNQFIATIDPPMWSIAVECDIYILFPLLLVPLARRFGFLPMVIGGFILGFTPTLLGALHHTPIGYRFSETCPWYIGLFALGYAAANFHVSQTPANVARLRSWPWRWITVGFFILLMATVVFSKPYDMTHGTRWLTDLFLGLAIAAQFTADAQARAHGRKTLFERFFLLRPLLFLGTFSYSFYLIHLPIIDLLVSFSRPGWTDAQVLCITIVGVALAIGIAYAFYLAFERPFMTAYRRRGDGDILRASQVREIAD